MRTEFAQPWDPGDSWRPGSGDKNVGKRVPFNDFPDAALIVAFKVDVENRRNLITVEVDEQYLPPEFPRDFYGDPGSETDDPA